MPVQQRRPQQTGSGSDQASSEQLERFHQSGDSACWELLVALDILHGVEPGGMGIIKSPLPLEGVLLPPMDRTFSSSYDIDRKLGAAVASRSMVDPIWVSTTRPPSLIMGLVLFRKF